MLVSVSWRYSHQREVSDPQKKWALKVIVGEGDTLEADLLREAQHENVVRLIVYWTEPVVFRLRKIL